MSEPLQASDPYRAMLESYVGRVIDDGPSPLGNWLAGTLLAVEDDGLTVAYTVRPEMLNAGRVLHGGIAATMMDELLGASVMMLSGGRYHASVNLAVDYLAPARSGETLTARSRILRRGKRLVNATCTLANANGDLVAHATTNLLAADA